MMIAEALPTFRVRAADLARRHRETKATFDAISVSPDLPAGSERLVKLAMDAGRSVEPDERVETMLAKIKRHVQGRSPSDITAILTAALNELHREEEQQDIERAVAGMEAELTAGDEDNDIHP